MRLVASGVASEKRQRRLSRSAWGLGLTAAALGAMLVSFAARAADAGPGQGTGGAARLSSVEGQVRLMQGGQVLADPALVNAPLFAGTQVVTGNDGKAEVQFDDGSIARISPDSAITLRSIAGDGGPGTFVVLDGGLGYFELQNDQTRVMFADAAVTVSGFTVLRVNFDNPPGEVAVFSGNARLERGTSPPIDLHGGESLPLNTDATNYAPSDSIEPDSWDQWNQDRDQTLNALTADQTGAPSTFVNSESEAPGWSDLDANGSWYNVPGQGSVWSPFEASDGGWDPYGCGSWMWTPRFGYVWVSCESWGFMPYSCGAWSFYDSFGWGWSPGMGGCMPWWRNGGGYRGWNIGRAPVGYPIIPRPISRGPIGRIMPPILGVNRHSFAAPGVLPLRSRNEVVQIGGQTVVPLRPRPEQGGERSASGFVYRPGYQNSTPARGGRQFGVPGGQYNYTRPDSNNPHPAYGEPQRGQGTEHGGPANMRPAPTPMHTAPQQSRPQPRPEYSAPRQSSPPPPPPPSHSVETRPKH